MSVPKGRASAVSRLKTTSKLYSELDFTISGTNLAFHTEIRKMLQLAKPLGHPHSQHAVLQRYGTDKGTNKNKLRGL
jgi:hypothetical protein